MTGVSERARAHRRDVASADATAGRRAVTRVLEALPRDRWTVLEDRIWPDRTGTGDMVLAIGPGGIFAIRTRSWDWRAPVHRGAVVPAGSAAASLAAVAPPECRRLVAPVLCLCGPEGVREDVDGVAVCSPDTLVAMLLSRPERITRDRVAELRAELQPHLPPALQVRVPVPRPPVERAHPGFSRLVRRLGVGLAGGAAAVTAAALATSPALLQELLGLLSA